MKHHNRQGDLHSNLSQLVEMRFHTSVCICFVDVQCPTMLSNEPSLHLFYFTASQKFNRILTIMKHHSRQGEQQ